MKIQNKSFVYLISPTKISNNNFFKYLELVFKSKKVSFFQLRLKNEKLSKKIIISKKIIKICRKYKVKFLVNDDPILALKVNADGCHLGQKDMNIIKAKKILKKIKKSINLPIVAIGGVNEKNYKKLLLNKADFLAISGYIWKNRELEPYQAIQRLK